MARALLAGGDFAAAVAEQTDVRRAEIHQATGIVLAQLGVNPEEALARLRGYAFVARRAHRASR